MPEFNLESIKQEIESRRSTHLVTEQETGTGRMGASRDSKKFLIGLLNSVNSGVVTPELKALRTVTEMSDVKYGVPTTAGKPAPQVQQTQYTQPQQNVQYQPQVLNEHGGAEIRADDTYFEQQMQRGMDLLRMRSGQNQAPNNAGLSQALNEYATAPFLNQPSTGGINAGALNEHINRSLNEMTNNANFVRLVEAAYKNMINEMFAKEKIETALVEIVQGDTFKKIMKKTIVDTLLEIQNRNKK